MLCFSGEIWIESTIEIYLIMAANSPYVNVGKSSSGVVEQSSESNSARHPNT